jgi:RNA polymerase sigma factor (sigma-70 family)
MNAADPSLIVTILFERWHRSLLRYALHFPLTYEMAEEVVQETYLQLYQALQAGTPIKYPKAWVFCVLRRAVKRKLMQECIYEPLDPDEQIYDPQKILNDALSFNGLLKQLSARERQVVLLRLDHWKYREIADSLNISMNTVDTLLGRAFRKLRTFLNP